MVTLLSLDSWVRGGEGSRKLKIEEGEGNDVNHALTTYTGFSHGGARLAMEGAKTAKMPPRSLIIIGSLNHYKTSIYLFDNLPESL